MTKFLLSAAALAAVFATPAIAADQPAKHSFTRDGETYVYTIAEKTHGVELNGRSFPWGGDFHLFVRGDRIEGDSNGFQVSFKVPNAQASIAPTTDVASR